MKTCFQSLSCMHLCASVLIVFLYKFGFAQNVGIGTTSPTSKLEVVGPIRITNPGYGLLHSYNGVTLGTYVDGDGGWIGTQSNHPLYFFTYDSDPWMTLDVAGRFGIGTSTPTAILEVNGDVKINGKISNVADPITAQDAATKAYVDLLEARLMELEGIKDIENNQYDIVSIGTQVWMTENLRVTRYNDGTPIPLVTDNTAWTNLTSPAYTWYDNSASDYGALYNYYVVADTNSHNVCPVGWHVPADVELTILNDMLGGISVAGGKMKETGLEHWLSPNANAYNDSGFAGLPGGIRHPLGTFNSVGTDGLWWSSTELNTVSAWFRTLYYITSAFPRGDADKRNGFSVRCLRD